MNNPLNIRRTSVKWRGELPSHLGEGKGERGSFCHFSSLEYGLRAAFCILRTYALKHRCSCVRDIVTRWAPPSENDTERYIRNVCLWTGFGGYQRLTEAEWPALVTAMARMESGVTLDPEMVMRAYELYLSEKTK